MNTSESSSAIIKSTKKRSAKIPAFKASNDEERAEIMEWMQQHPLLYDKYSVNFCHKEAKKVLQQKKAQEFGIDGVGDEAGERLKRWVKTQKAKVGKTVRMSKGASGSEAIKLTAENSKFLQRYGWIHQYRNIKGIGSPSVAGLVSFYQWSTTVCNCPRTSP